MSAAAAAASTGAAAPPALQGGVVRSVLSGDTLIVRAKGVNTPGSESIVHIAGIAAPRMGSRERDDEPQAFASREFLRTLLVGREVRYRQEYVVPVAGAAPRVFAHVFLPPETPGGPDTNVSHKVLSAGWARVHDSGSRRNANATPEEEEEGGWKAVQRRVQDEAQGAARGLWGPDDLLRVEYNMPTDGMAFLSQWKGKEIDAVVEQVRDGSMLRLRLFLTPRHHQLINLSLAGVKSPRVAGAGGPGSNEPSEPFAEEARFFVESRLMQRNVKVSLLSMPAPTSAPTPFGSNAPTPAPTAPSMLIGSVLHPVGDIATFLLGAGLARCVDWHAGMLQGGMEKYRQAERAAKEKRSGIWKNWQPANAGSNGAAGAGAASLLASPEARTFDAIVTRIISGDTLQVRRASPADSPELRVHLSSIRQPQAKDSAQAGYAHEAREFLRKRCIGKGVRVHIDWVKKPEGQFEERRYATVLTTTGSKETKGSSVGELLIQKGLATVTRHRRDDEDRSPEFDKLMAAEASAVAEKRGLHSGKPMDAPRLVDASESAGKANSFLLALKRGGKQAAVVDFVASASRFKLIVPRENARITFVLAGIRAPRTARNANEKDEPYGREGLEYTSAHALMRDCEIAVEGVDKVGGFIGALYLNRSENYAVTLVEQGLASVHGYSADNLSYGPQLRAAETAAKAARKGMWADWSEEKEAAATGAATAASAAAAGPSSRTNGWGAPAAPVAARDEYVDVVVSDVRGDAGASGTLPFAFSVQILDDKIQGLESLQAELNRAVPPAAPAGFTPRSGDLLLAKFSGDGAWYRAQVTRAHPAQRRAAVTMIDYGSRDDVAYSDLRPLDARFGKSRLAPMAHDCRLSFVALYEGKAGSGADEYAAEAQDRFRELEGRKLIANIDQREAGASGSLHLTLYDPDNASTSPEACINVDLVREGYALPDRKVAYYKARPAIVAALEAASAEARRYHRGIFELGDPTGADD